MAKKKRYALLHAIVLGISVPQSTATPDVSAGMMSHEEGANPSSAPRQVSTVDEVDEDRDDEQAHRRELAELASVSHGRHDRHLGSDESTH